MTSECICVKDFERLATKRLTDVAISFFNSGSTNDQTFEENCSSFKRWRFRPMVLRDVTNTDMTTTVLCDKIPFPICIAPIGCHQLASPRGELEAAEAAAELGTGFTLSTFATQGFEDIATNVPSVLRWFQLYIFKDRELTRQLIKRAEKYGFRAIFVTVDRPVKKERRFLALSKELRLKNVEGSRSSDDNERNQMMETGLTWREIVWLKSITHLPIVIKGVMTPELACEAVEHAVNGIVVSNHGGRQLDGVLATIDALPGIVKAVGGKCEVFIDGGIRNGNDIAKAIALGAKAVFVGRPVIWGVACGGKAGAVKVLKILRDELELAMKLLGVNTIDELQNSPDLVVHQSKIIAKL